jgi:hypothetical protein
MTSSRVAHGSTIPPCPPPPTPCFSTTVVQSWHVAGCEPTNPIQLARAQRLASNRAVATARDTAEVDRQKGYPLRSRPHHLQFRGPLAGGGFVF